MISLDMKYTSLYWALRFVEDDVDVHIKSYGSYNIIIQAEKQRVNYGSKIKVINKQCNYLTRHKDFVILECIDRLLIKGYKPQDIKIDGRENHPDIIVEDKLIYCEKWGSDYLEFKKDYSDDLSDYYKILYTSRLVSGLLEFKNIITYKGITYSYGVFEKNIDVYDIKLAKLKEVVIKDVPNASNFVLEQDELILYKGKDKLVVIPEGVTTIGASAFWNNTFVEEIILPNSLLRLGGDAFYYCTNLMKINIPENVWIIGNNPFAGCPKLVINNRSKHFILDDGVLFSSNMKNLIHYSIYKKEEEYIIPNTITCLGKHSFYDCNGLHNIVVPKSVIRFENNPFAGCSKLNVVNHSSYYHFDEGIIYNKFRTTIIGVLGNTILEEYTVPDSVTLISRNSFWNCKGIKKLILSKNIKRIGYNPFASCENMTIISKNHDFKVIGGILYNKDLSELICCPNSAVREKVKIRDGVKYINRGAFSGCINLKEIDFNQVIDIAKSSFTNCTSLTKLYIPDRVNYIGEWAFAYCNKLLTIEVHKSTVIGKNALNECPAKIIIRG